MLIILTDPLQWISRGNIWARVSCKLVQTLKSSWHNRNQRRDFNYEQAHRREKIWILKLMANRLCHLWEDIRDFLFNLKLTVKITYQWVYHCLSSSHNEVFNANFRWVKSMANNVFWKFTSKTTFLNMENQYPVKIMTIFILYLVTSQ